jgi:hypothetical protein
MAQVSARDEWRLEHARFFGKGGPKECSHGSRRDGRVENGLMFIFAGFCLTYVAGLAAFIIYVGSKMRTSRYAFWIRPP